METTRLDMALVFPSENGRPVVGAQVERLAESLSALGLRQPITVRACKRFIGGQETEAFEIVAGRHRYEAAVKLKWEDIDGFVMDGSADDAELWEIDENFARSELSDAQRADHHKRREAILVRKGLVAEPGQGGDRRSSAKSALDSYAVKTAADLGVSRRKVETELARGKKIDADVLSDVAGTALDKGVVLDELARTPQADQADKLAEIAARYKAKTPLAADPLNDLEATEKQLAALMSAWNRAGPEAREKFLATVDGPVFDRGRS
jgi:hypothetical protein